MPLKAATMPRAWFTNRQGCTRSSATGGVFDAEFLDSRPGIIVLRVSGKGADVLLQEGGGVRWQRVPPNEKRGRRHTSTVTVAVLREPEEADVHLEDRDLDVKACRGSGAGGQNRNKVSSAIQMTHKPSGISVRVETERSQHQNLRLARALLSARLLEQEESRLVGDRNQTRKAQVGVGARGDKVVTVSTFRDTAVHHRTGKRTSSTRYMRGFIEDLWA